MKASRGSAAFRSLCGDCGAFDARIVEGMGWNGKDGMFNQCSSMVINVDQCWSILDNVDQCWSMLTVLINVHLCWPVLISVDQCWSLVINIGQCCLVLMLMTVDQGWPVWINGERWWPMLISVDQCWPILLNVAQNMSMIVKSLIVGWFSKGLKNSGAEKVMKLMLIQWKSMDMEQIGRY